MLNVRLNRTPTTPSARIATVTVLLAMTIAIASAQTTFATLSGSVSDQAGAMVPNVTLILLHVQSSAKYEVRTDDAGRFEFVGLRSGNYVLETKFPGFKTQQDKLTISVGQTVQRNITLQLGTLVETIRVVGSVRDTTSPRAAQPPPPPPPPPPPAAPLQRVDPRASQSRTKPDTTCIPSSVGGRVRPPNKLKDVKPRYPGHLRASKVEGSVVLAGRVGTDGSFKELRVVSATNNDFADAALEAVSQWQFSPTYLNCVPVDVEIDTTVNFSVEQ